MSVSNRSLRYLLNMRRIIPAAEILIRGMIYVFGQKMDGAVAKEELGPSRMAGFEAKGDVPVLPGMFCVFLSAANAVNLAITAIVDGGYSSEVAATAVRTGPVLSPRVLAETPPTGSRPWS